MTIVALLVSLAGIALLAFDQVISLRENDKLDEMEKHASYLDETSEETAKEIAGATGLKHKDVDLGEVYAILSQASAQASEATIRIRRKEFSRIVGARQARRWIVYLGLALTFAGAILSALAG